MIKLGEMLTENRDLSARRGCLMCMVSKKDSDLIVEFGKRLIKDEDLYVENNEYGRESSPCHITLRYGFLKDLNELEIRQLLQNQKPFMVEIIGLNKFENPPKYSVSVFKVNSPVLKQLNEMSGIYLNENDYPEYLPHLTLCYTKPNANIPVKEGLKLKTLITEICYSPIQGGKSYFNLDEGNIHHDIDSQIARLEQEWERLDAMGGNTGGRQQDIEQELIHLRYEKEGQPLGPNDPKSKELWDKLKQSI